MAKETKILSPAKSFKGFSILKFLWGNKVKILAIALALIGALTQQYPELYASLSGATILLEQLYKFWSKEQKA